MRFPFAIAALVAVSTLPAHADSLIIRVPCGPFEDFQRDLGRNYGEQQTGSAKLDGAAVMLLFLNPKTKTFTIVVRKGDTACAPVSGTDLTFHIGEPT